MGCRGWTERDEFTRAQGSGDKSIVGNLSGQEASAQGMGLGWSREWLGRLTYSPVEGSPVLAANWWAYFDGRAGNKTIYLAGLPED